jgi:hypothetical protein
MTSPVTAEVGVPGGWLGTELRAETSRWRIAMPDAVAAELLSQARDFVHGGASWEPLAQPVPVSSATESLLAAVRAALADGPWLVVLTGFPVEADPRLVEAAYWLFGQQIGPPVSQTRDGGLLVRVEDRGADIRVPTQRGHRSASALAFHADRADVVGLLCIRPAAEGGQSRVVSSRALHNIVLAERPHLLPVLYGSFPNDQRGEQPAGCPGWCSLPVFSRVDGDFAARYVRRFIEDSQRHEAAPRLTDQQRDAMDFLDEILARPGVALDMDLRPGDLQLINNSQVLHARSAFRDVAGPGRAGRLLLRLWLSFRSSPALPDEYAALYGETARGARRGGVWPATQGEGNGPT